MSLICSFLRNTPERMILLKWLDRGQLERKISTGRLPIDARRYEVFVKYPWHEASKRLTGPQVKNFGQPSKVAFAEVRFSYAWRLSRARRTPAINTTTCVSNTPTRIFWLLSRSWAGHIAHVVQRDIKWCCWTAPYLRHIYDASSTWNCRIRNWWEFLRKLSVPNKSTVGTFA